MPILCGICKEPADDLTELREHFAERHPDELRRYEAENGPLDQQIAAAPLGIIDPFNDPPFV